MHRKLVLSALISVLLLSCIEINLQFIEPAKASPETWTVDDDGPADFHTIQEAINAASYGDTIYVYNGTYYENVVVNKTVSLIGENKETTIFYGNGTQTILKIVNRKVNVKSFTIQNGAKGVYLTGNADSCILEDSEIINSAFGIFVESDNNVLTRNIFVNNSESGIEILPSCGCSPLQGNIVTENTLLNNSYGIRLSFSDEGLVYHNSFIGNTKQAFTISSNTTWDDGYPSGGNYWGDYAGDDTFSGIYQNETGYDWIGDSPYIIGEDNQDNYPLMSPYELFVRYGELESSFQTLLSNYTELLGTYDSIQANYNLLNSSYNSLNATYDELKSEQEATISELNNIRNLMYIFIATTIVLIATTAYFAKRKPKIKP